MTAATVGRPREGAAAPYLAAYQAFAKNGAGNAPAWLRDLREAGIARFAEVGFPSTKAERWRFTSVEQIARGAFALAAPGLPAGVRAAVQELAVSDPAASLLAG